MARIHRPRVAGAVFFLFVGLSLGDFPAQGASLLVRDGSDPNVGGFGKPGTEQTTSFVSLAFESVEVASDFSDLDQLLSFDAVWVNTDDRNLTLSATEHSNLQSFAATGRPLALFGENEVWDTWNQSTTAVAEAAANSNETFGGALTPVVAHALVDGVLEVHISAGGLAVGAGISLFDHSVVMLFDDNVLAVLDSGLFKNEDFGGGLENGSNRVFRDNLVEWLGGDLSRVPEPGTGLLILVGLIVMARSPRFRS